MMFKCPGSQRFSQPQPENIMCPYCKGEVEIWTDEMKTVCCHCKKTIVKGEMPSCMDWCKYAKKCLGEEAYNRYLKNKEQTEKLRKKEKD